ncbi:unnamed protein product [Rotaria sp. Silwood2]|nr:unnamed protein product [Rotaria sp. Silwood2]CAF2923611.1 unnamed protein product [Rotaria sp. Silwood2]CAF3339238.1 unnamed protein product [Rotaria sp. Silwood2]CAF4199866.1 unnamed protein product [Rotaria sp. Silwood2]CAF4502901.1 unnamed protein product [Rotaria sp. Silwood2]
MPIYYDSSSRKSNGFSIDDIIKNNDSSKTSNRLSSSYIPSITWLPSQITSIYQFQRESMLQYLRHTNQFTNSGSVAAFFLNSYRKPKRNRTAFTPSQLLKLENAFEKNHYIVGQERKELAKHLNLPEARVKVWYQNRRTKHKRLINEDGNSSTNETDHHNESDRIIENSDEHIWNNEENSKHYQLNFNHRQEKSYSN